MHRYAHVFLLFFFFVHSFSFVTKLHHPLANNDLETMRALAKHLPRLPLNTNYWNTTDPNPCLWGYRVGCSAEKTFSRVTELSLAGLGLYTSNATATSSATFFRLLCRLDALQYLDLSENSFTSIPDSFLSNCSGLSGLKSLDLSYNKLSGPLGNFSSFRALEELYLFVNTFRGQVRLDGLPHLRRLLLLGNFLNGTFLAPSSLQDLFLSYNIFDCLFPMEILQLKNLSYLEFHHNNLYGPIPDEIGELSKLTFLDISSNALTGKIPDSLSSIKTLQSFYAGDNKLVGRIPIGITSYLRDLDLSNNRLYGDIPSNLLASPVLEYVYFTSNLLEGPIPRLLSPNLSVLALGGNFLNGSIPPAIGQLASLETLKLDGNMLSGEIPWQLEKCKSLWALNLSANQLQGELPAKLGKLSKLQILLLHDNKLSGKIPTELSELVNLTALSLGNDLLSGEIPSAIMGLNNLTSLNLEGNKIDGPIPDSIINLDLLMELLLGHNKLSGTVPRMPSSLSLTLNLSGNLFGGPIPGYLGNLNRLTTLDLSGNKFVGEVPNSLSKMENLSLLVLSYNQLSGTLPDFPSWVAVNATGINFTTADNVDESKYPEMTNAASLTKFDIMVLVGAFVGGFITSISLAIIVQKVICSNQARKKPTVIARRGSWVGPSEKGVRNLKDPVLASYMEQAADGKNRREESQSMKRRD